MRNQTMRWVCFATAAFWVAESRGGAGEWPVPHFRTLPPPRVLYLADTPNRELWAERLRAVAPAEVTLAPLEYGDLECHHLCDKPLEETPEDVQYVRQEGWKYVDAALAQLEDFDVVIAQFQPRSGDEATNAWLFEIQQRLVERVRQGGRLIFINPSWETTFEGTPLADILPVQFDGQTKAWTTGCEGATDHPLTRGLPFEVTGSHWYGPVYQPVDETCLPLTRNPHARFWYRPLLGGGQVVHLFADSGQKWDWGGTNYATYAAERPDDSAVWDAFHQRLLYWLTYGDRAFPVLTKIDLPAGTTCRSGEELSVPVEVENRSGKAQEVTVSLQISVRRWPRRISQAQTLSLEPGEKKTVPFQPKVSIPCVDPFLHLQAWTLGKAGGRHPPVAFSESSAWIPFVHQAPVTVQVPQASYRPGETFPTTATLSPPTTHHPPSTTHQRYTVQLFLVDRRGRSLQSASGAVTASGNAEVSWSANFVMPDGGPELVSSYWITALVRSGEAIVGSARTQVQVDQPWDMRQQLQWSVWTNPGLTPRAIALFRDAGFNALGMIGDGPAADRYGLRQYVESTGINTFGVTIDHDNWDAVRASMEQTIENLEKSGPDARSKALVSLGEESGFAGGWGTRYYWAEDRAPPLPQKVFDDYLTELYHGRIEDLNAEWGTAYQSFAEVPLERAKVKAPGQVFVGAQAWAALAEDKKQDVLPVELQKVDPQEKYLARSAPYYETYRFFDWYYQKYCDLATAVYRTRRNPVPRTIMSAPGGFYPQVDVYNFGGVGPFYPKETALVGNAIARRDYGDIPGFSGAMWAYFDLATLWKSTVLSSLVAGNTHVDYWVDFPLTFNADLTHTRASFWTKGLTRQLRSIEPILLHKRIAYTGGLGMYIPVQPVPKGLSGQHFGSAIDPNAPVYSALEESGYLPQVVHADDLDPIRVLVASYAQVVSPEDGRKIAEFVRNGGTLMATPWLASCSPHGSVLSVYPAPETGLADLLGFKLLNTSQEPRPEEVPVDLTKTCPLEQPLTLLSRGRDTVLEIASDVQVWARYQDDTPLLLARQVGKGRIIYLNLIYDWSDWWNSFHEPSREAFRRLIEGIVRADGRVHRDYFLAFESAEAVEDNKGWWGMVMKTQPQPGESVPWWASQLYTDPSGKVKYLGVFTDHRSPKITARLHLTEPHVRVFDLFTGQEVPDEGNGRSLTLRPGEAAFWAILSQVPARLQLSAPRQVTGGQPIPLTLRLPGLEKSEAVCGVVVDVFDPTGTRSTAHSLSNVNVANGGAQVSIPTAENDPPGVYHLVATECITRRQAEGWVRLTASSTTPATPLLNPFPDRAADTWPVGSLSSEQFLEELRQLRRVYEGEFAGLEAKYRLSYYLNVPFRPSSRHALLRRLQRVDWTPHLPAVARALRAGERFYLLGEDLNVDPLTKEPIDPFAVAKPADFIAALKKQSGARRRTIKAEGLNFEVIEMGRGVFITSDASVDRAAYHSSDFIAWQERLKQALAEVSRPLTSTKRRVQFPPSPPGSRRSSVSVQVALTPGPSPTL